MICTGFDYNYANPTWISSPFSSVGILELTAVLYTLAIAFAGYPVFLFPNSYALLAYNILNIICFCFAFAIACVTIAAGASKNTINNPYLLAGYVNLSLGCNAPVSGLFHVFNHIDGYIQNVDQAFCSDECPCNLKNNFFYVSNSTLAPIFANWNVTNSTIAPTSYANCTNLIQTNVYKKTTISDPKFDTDKSFKVDNFVTYMGRIESLFKCTGWCSVDYKTPKNENTKIIKYLFSDINNGVPEHFGCYNELVNWLPAYLLSYGSLIISCVFFQIVILILGLMLSKSKNSEDQIKEEVQIKDMNQIKI